MSLEIQLAGGNPAFAPGETIAGTMRWQLDRAPEWIELRLFWYTEGKGTQDVGVGPIERADHPQLQGEQPFSLRAPNLPPSCSGRLVSVRWALELVTSQDDPVSRTELVIGPDRREILLGHAE